MAKRPRIAGYRERLPMPIYLGCCGAVASDSTSQPNPRSAAAAGRWYQVSPDSRSECLPLGEVRMQEFDANLASYGEQIRMTLKPW
jgi:hypothetical protein